MKNEAPPESPVPVAETVVPSADVPASVAELPVDPPEGGVVVEVVAESPAAARAMVPAATAVPSMLLSLEATSVSVSAAATTELMLRQAPQPAQGPRGQSPVGGSPEVVVVTASVVVVVSDFGASWWSWSTRPARIGRDRRYRHRWCRRSACRLPGRGR